MKKRITQVLILPLLATLTAAVEVSGPLDDTARISRIQPTIYGSRQPQPINVNSIQQPEPTPTSKSISTASSLTTIAAKIKQSPSASIPTTASKLGGSTLFNIQEQMQPPALNAQHYLFPTLPTRTTTPNVQQFIPSGGPYVMQILNSAGQPTGQIQYIQFLRPVVMPFMPISAQLSATTPPSPSYTPPSPAQYAAAASAPVAQAYTQSSASIAAQYAPSAQISSTTVSDGGFYPYATQPVASYSAPAASFYPPQVYSTNRIRLVSGPGELSLNTNEYVPASSDVSYSAVKPMRA